VNLLFEDADEFPPLHTDEGKVSQILRNLISNAIKFTPNGSVVVSASMQTNGNVEFRVADTGIGIAPEHHETIFKEFSQLENPLQDRYRGTGLGLPLCRNLAKLLGGEISLESELGKGSTFFVKVPAVYVGELMQPDSGDMPPAPEFYREPVLILEDDIETAHLFESYLRNSEFQAILTSNIAQAEVWSARHAPKVLLLDVYLDDDQCWEFLSRIRERWPGVPCIATSISDESAAARRNGVDAFFLKPIDKDVLLQELRRQTAQTGTRRILVVDDNEISRYILRDLLDQPWMEIVEAASAKDALASIRENAPNAIILDLLMPDVSGLDLLRQLRAQRALEKLPILVYTSKELSEPERLELEELNAPVIRKGDVTSRLSTQPFLDWARSSGLSPETIMSERNA
jgi:DNA-binding response OmpR family regulator/anti-sigma regulatory factor (Ser/Thr protein kinase)